MPSLPRSLTLTLSALALAAAASAAHATDWLSLLGVPAGQAVNGAAPRGDSPVVITAATGLPLRDGSYAGPSFDAYYGLVQVQANVLSGHLISVDVLQSPNHRSTSRAINRQALPMLEREVIRAQNTKVNIISGATLTSRAYLRSLKAALQQASS